MWARVGASRRPVGAVVAVITSCVVVTAAAVPGLAASSPGSGSLDTNPSPRPGPGLLYQPPATAPQLTNSGVWQAPPILVSGASAYRQGEYLYQDFLYDDHGPHEMSDPTDARGNGDTFSKPNGTYTYPTAPGYANNAADLVELRVKPQAQSTTFRVTLNTLENTQLPAFSIAIGGTPGRAFPFPYGANVTAPADIFLTVHPDGHGMVADLVNAADGRPVQGPTPQVRVDTSRRQIEVDVAHQAWTPGQNTVRLAAGVGLWDGAHHRYLLPQAVADATHPGGGGTAQHPAGFFNVAFRNREPLPSVTAGPDAVSNAAWWRDQQQGNALARGDISSFFADIDFGKLTRKAWDDSDVPASGAIDRILPSHFEPSQGADFSHECGFQGASAPGTCVPEYRGQLQPYAIYIPSGRQPMNGYGTTLLLHSLSANYNQYSGSRNQEQFGERAEPSVIITPEARGPDQFYRGLGAADVFEAWADVARHYRLDPAHTDITGYSMGGMGTFQLGTQFPDLFARAQPTVGFGTNNDVLPSLRNLPVLMWNNAADELVNPALYEQNASTLAKLGYRYTLDVFQPCANPNCSPLFPNHLELAVNDQYAPAAAFLGTATVHPNPPHVTYVVDTAWNRPELGLVADHAYWFSGLTLRDSLRTGSTGDPEGKIDGLSRGFGLGDPAAIAAQPSTGTLTGGNLGPLLFGQTGTSWGPTPPAVRGDEIDITATNIATASVDVQRAHVDCNVTLHITTDGPITVNLPGCHRAVHAG